MRRVMVAVSRSAAGTAPPTPPPTRRGSPRTTRARSTGASPTGVPSSSPRSVSMIGVTGWCAAKPCSHDGHRVDRDERAAGVRQEHHEEREPVRRLGRAGEQADRGGQPRHGEDEREQDRRPTASQASGVGVRAGSRAPRATPITSTVDATLRATLAATWPASTAGPPTSIERKRSMIPPVMSCADAHRGRRRAEAGAQQDDARHDVGDVVVPGLDRAAEQVDEHQHQHHRQHQRGEQRVDVAHRQAHRARRHGERIRHGMISLASSVVSAGMAGQGEEDVVEGRAVDRERARPRSPSGSTASSSARTCAAVPSVATPSTRPSGSRRSARPPSSASTAANAAASASDEVEPLVGDAALELGGRALGDDAAAVDDRDPVGEAGRPPRGTAS